MHNPQTTSGFPLGLSNTWFELGRTESGAFRSDQTLASGSSCPVKSINEALSILIETNAHRLQELRKCLTSHFQSPSCSSLQLTGGEDPCARVPQEISDKNSAKWGKKDIQAEEDTGLPSHCVQMCWHLHDDIAHHRDRWQGRSNRPVYAHQGGVNLQGARSSFWMLI